MSEEVFKLTQEEIDKIEYFINKWIEVKEQHRQVGTESLHIRNVPVRGIDREVALVVFGDADILE
jgi:hypothetical protein